MAQPGAARVVTKLHLVSRCMTIQYRSQQTALSNSTMAVSCLAQKNFVILPGAAATMACGVTELMTCRVAKLGRPCRAQNGSL